MVLIQIPGVSIGPIVINKGQFLNVSLLGLKIVVPPIAIQIIPRITLWEPIVLFDTDDLFNAVTGVLTAIPQAVWNFVTSWLEQQVEEYEKTHQEE